MSALLIKTDLFWVPVSAFCIVLARVFISRFGSQSDRVAKSPSALKSEIKFRMRNILQVLVTRPSQEATFICRVMCVGFSLTALF